MENCNWLQRCPPRRRSPRPSHLSRVLSSAYYPLSDWLPFPVVPTPRDLVRWTMTSSPAKLVPCPRCRTAVQVMTWVQTWDHVVLRLERHLPSMISSCNLIMSNSSSAWCLYVHYYLWLHCIYYYCYYLKVIKVVSHKATLPPHTDYSVVFARWCQCAPSLDPHDSASRTASRSVQPFFAQLTV